MTEKTDTGRPRNTDDNPGAPAAPTPSVDAYGPVPNPPDQNGQAEPAVAATPNIRDVDELNEIAEMNKQKAKDLENETWQDRLFRRQHEELVQYQARDADSFE